MIGGYQRHTKQGSVHGTFLGGKHLILYTILKLFSHLALHANGAVIDNANACLTNKKNTFTQSW